MSRREKQLKCWAEGGLCLSKCHRYCDAKVYEMIETKKHTIVRREGGREGERKKERKKRAINRGDRGEEKERKKERKVHLI